MSDLTEHAANPSLIGQLLRYVGGFTQPSGRGLFMFRMMTTSASTAAITGLGTAYTTGVFFGPLAAVGFTIGSCVGYVLATIYYFRLTMEQALAAFDTYPRLMMLHLASNYTTYGFEKVRMETVEDKVRFQRRLGGSLTLRCFLLSSYHTAAPAIDEITSRKEAAIVSQLSQESTISAKEELMDL